MKGTIVKCLQELVVEKFGKDKWDAVLNKVEGMPKLIMPIADIPDAMVMQAVGATCEVLGITLQQAADAFGDYWVNVYAQKMYPEFFKNRKTAKEFILAMDAVHDVATKNMEHAHPPRFKYEWKDPKTLFFHYTSSRNLIDFAVGLLKGVARFYKENLKVTKLSDQIVEIIFP
ncbi:MAG: heme NO-binding domain-containing protein [candidate division FCPU426 bacterium]